MAKIVQKIKKDNEIGSRKALIEELFYDFNRSRHQVYWINFLRGIFFGLGSVLGATVLVVVLLWLLHLFVNIPGGIGHFVQQIIDAVNARQTR